MAMFDDPRLEGFEPALAPIRYMMAPNERRRRRDEPPVVDYGQWTLRPEIAKDLGGMAPQIENMLRTMGPMFGGPKLFRAVMTPPAAPPATLPPVFNRMVSQAPEAQQSGLRNMLMAAGPALSMLPGMGRRQQR